MSGNTEGLRVRAEIEPEAQAGAQRRNRNFDETHRLLIDKAVALISRGGPDALSISALARETGINRSTVYYHFESREALTLAVKQWTVGQLVNGWHGGAIRPECMVGKLGFGLDQPELLKLWIEDFIAPGDIRLRYPDWDRLVAGVGGQLRQNEIGADPAVAHDEEVFCAMLLAVAFVAPRVFANSVAPGEPREAIVGRFARQLSLLLGLVGIIHDPLAV